MKNIIKDVLSCKSLRDGVKAALAAIVVAVLERVILLLKGEDGNVHNYGVQ